MDDAETPGAVLVLVVAGHELPLGAIGTTKADNLHLVDDLLRLRLAVGRHGAGLRLVDVRPDLRELLNLVGVAETLGLASPGDDGPTPRCAPATRSERTAPDR